MTTSNRKKIFIYSYSLLYAEYSNTKCLILYIVCDFFLHCHKDSDLTKTFR